MWRPAPTLHDNTYLHTGYHQHTNTSQPPSSGELCGTTGTATVRCGKPQAYPSRKAVRTRSPMPSTRHSRDNAACQRYHSLTARQHSNSQCYHLAQGPARYTPLASDTYPGPCATCPRMPTCTATLALPPASGDAFGTQRLTSAHALHHRHAPQQRAARTCSPMPHAHRSSCSPPRIQGTMRHDLLCSSLSLEVSLSFTAPRSFSSFRNANGPPLTSKPLFPNATRQCLV